MRRRPGFSLWFPPLHLGRHELNWRTQGQGSPPGARSRKYCHGGEANSLINIPPDPSQRWRVGAHMGSIPPDHATPARKNFKYRSKSITQRNLTEIEPSRKSAAARKQHLKSSE